MPRAAPGAGAGRQDRVAAPTAPPPAIPGRAAARVAASPCWWAAFRHFNKGSVHSPSRSTP